MIKHIELPRMTDGLLAPPGGKEATVLALALALALAL